MSTGMQPNPYGTPTMQGGATPSVPNYLVQSILVTLCCCIPGGIVAIVYAAQVNSKLAAGDYDGALQSSNNAKLWCWISLGVGIVVNLIAIVAQIMIVGAAQQQQGM